MRCLTGSHWLGLCLQLFGHPPSFTQSWDNNPQSESKDSKFNKPRDLDQTWNLMCSGECTLADDIEANAHSGSGNDRFRVSARMCTNLQCAFSAGRPSDLQQQQQQHCTLKNTSPRVDSRSADAKGSAQGPNRLHNGHTHESSVPGITLSRSTFLPTYVWPERAHNFVLCFTEANVNCS